MKKFFCSTVIIVGISLQIYAQPGPLETIFKPKAIDSTAKDINYRKNKVIVCLYPFAFLGNSLTVGIEYKLFKYNSFRLILGYATAEQSNYYEVKNLNEFYSELQYRVYPNRKSINNMNGIFFGMYGLAKTRSYDRMVSNNNFNFTSTTTQQFNNQAGGMGLIVGIQGILYRVISVDFYLGGGLILPVKSEANGISNNVINSYKKEVNFHTGISVGYTF